MKIMKRCLQIALVLLLCVGVSNAIEAKTEEEIRRDITNIDKYIKYWNDEVLRIERGERILIPVNERYTKGKNEEELETFRKEKWPKITRYGKKLFYTTDRAKYERWFKGTNSSKEGFLVELERRVKYSKKMASNIKTQRIPKAKRTHEEKKELLASTSRENEQKDPKNTIYIATANPQYIIKGKSYMVYFESKSGSNNWKKRAASANDLIKYWPLWTQELAEGDKVTKIVAELHEGGEKTYNNVFVKKH